MANPNQQLRQQENELVKLRMQVRYLERATAEMQSWRTRLTVAIVTAILAAGLTYALTSRVDLSLALPVATMVVYIVVAQALFILQRRRR